MSGFSLDTWSWAGFLTYRNALVSTYHTSFTHSITILRHFGLANYSLEVLAGIQQMVSLLLDICLELVANPIVFLWVSEGLRDYFSQFGTVQLL